VRLIARRRTVVLRKDRFDEKEEDFYEALYTQSQAQFNSYVETSTVLNNYAHVFSLLVRLRQAVNHPYLVVHSTSGTGDAATASGQQGSCTICRDPLEDGVAAECGHAFCRACITEYLETADGVAACQACEKPLTIDLRNAPTVRILPLLTSAAMWRSMTLLMQRRVYFCETVCHATLDR
jgi:DNA repair protein RAD16